MKLPRQKYPVSGGVVKHNDLKNAYEDVGKVVNGNLEFGSPLSASSSNISGIWVTGTTPSTANMEFVVNVNLGRVPSGFLPFGHNSAGIIYRSTTPWTTTQIFLKSDTANMQYTIFVT